VERQVEKTAPTLEEAVEAALAELGVSEQEAKIEVLSEAGAGSAVVRVRAAPSELDREALEDQADAAADFVDELLAKMGLEALAEPAEHSGRMFVDITSEDEDDVALLIGRHGQTLDAIQELMRTVVARKLSERCQVLVDVGGYRRRREERLVARARDVANRVLRSGREEELEPMSSFERKIVHDAVSGMGGVETGSRGEEPDRRVVVKRAGKASPR
jgi:spoIIIJ-associated protein